MRQTTIIITETHASDTTFIISGSKAVLTEMAESARSSDDNDLARALMILADRVIPQLIAE